MAQKRIRRKQEQKDPVAQILSNTNESPVVYIPDSFLADPVIYIAGPFRAANAWLIEQNIRVAEQASARLWQAKIANHCPHTNTRHFHGLMPDSVFLRGEIAIMRRCDALLMLPNWQKSSGARKKHRIARKMGKLIFCNMEDVLGWYRR